MKKQPFLDVSTPITPTLAMDIDTLASSLAVVTEPGKSPDPDAFVQALMTTHNKLMGLKEALAQQAAAQRAKGEELAQRELDLNAREAKLNALDLLTGKVIGFDQKPAQVRKSWFRRG